VLYAVISYTLFLASFVYAIGFVGDLLVPKSINGPVGLEGGAAVAINIAVLLVFALQHSVMARPAFKRWWTRFVPPAIERSTYVLLSTVALVLVFVAWQPIPAVLWDLRGTLAGQILSGLRWAGWLICLLSTFLISHFELFGLSQVWYRLKNRPMPEGDFKEVLFYRIVRHPLMLGFLIAFWATPLMTHGHLLFALVMSAYIVVGVLLEERDLTAALGASYARYRDRVPMLIPFLKRAPKDQRTG